MGHFLKMGKIIFLKCLESRVVTGANDGSRTCDLLITNQLLYQLSYIGEVMEAASGVEPL